MTETAARLGMSGTQFRNANGLPDPGQMTTARDMAILALALVRDFPQYYGFFHTQEFMLGKRHIGPGIKFLDLYAPYADGLKTGFICASGFNLVGSALRDGRRLIAVAFGFRRADLRDEFLVRLFDEAFAMKTGGNRPKIWQVRNGEGGPGTVFAQNECGSIHYDMPGDAAWLGTYGDWKSARHAYRHRPGRARQARLHAPRQGVDPARHCQQADPAGRDHCRPRARRGAEAVRRLPGAEAVLPGQEAAGLRLAVPRLLALTAIRHLGRPGHSCHTAAMNWLTNFVRPKLRALVSRKEAPENLWLKCPKCEQMLFIRDWEANQEVCTHCGHHMRIRPLKRLPHLFDDGKYETASAAERAARSAEVPRHQALRRTPQGSAGQGRGHRRRAGRGERPDRRPHAP